MMRQTKCPNEVHQKVRQRLAATTVSMQNRKRRLFMWTEPAGVAFSVTVICLLILVQWNPYPSSDIDTPHAQTVDHERVAMEAKQSLTLLGGVLIEAGRLTEASVRREIEPSLFRSFTTIQQIIKQKGITHEE